MEHVAHDYERADLDPARRALCELADRMTKEPSSVREDDIERLRRHGWSDAAIHDAIQVIAYFNYVNRIADAVGIEDEPEWKADGPPR